jgi:hypothetical protein
MELLLVVQQLRSAHCCWCHEPAWLQQEAL